MAKVTAACYIMRALAASIQATPGGIGNVQLIFYTRKRADNKWIWHWDLHINLKNLRYGA